MPSLNHDARKRLFDIGSRGGCGFENPGELFESIIGDIYSTVLRPGDVAVDGGAHAGAHTFPMSKLVGPSGRIFAVEPIPELARALAKRAMANNGKNIRVIERALYDRIATVRFHHIRNNPGYSGIEARNYDFTPDIDLIEARTITLDELLRDRNFLRHFRKPGHWRFCKLDLEGGELRALQGGKSALRRYNPVVVFENGRESSARNYGYSREEWFKFFEEIDYGIFDLFGKQFERADWDAPDLPWYFIAVAPRSEEAQIIFERLPGILERYLGGHA